MTGLEGRSKRWEGTKITPSELVVRNLTRMNPPAVQQCLELA